MRRRAAAIAARLAGGRPAIRTTVQIWVWWLTVRSAVLAGFAVHDSQRWWDSAAYDFLRSAAPMWWWGGLWASAAALMLTGLVTRRQPTLLAGVIVWSTVQFVLWCSVVALLGSGQLTAITAAFHFADSLVGTGMVLRAAGRLEVRR